MAGRKKKSISLNADQYEQEAHADIVRQLKKEAKDNFDALAFAMFELWSQGYSEVYLRRWVAEKDVHATVASRAFKRLREFITRLQESEIQVNTDTQVIRLFDLYTQAVEVKDKLEIMKEINKLKGLTTAQMGRFADEAKSITITIADAEE